MNKCKDCGGSDLFWFTTQTVRNGIQQNRLNTHDVECIFVLGCLSCHATLRTRSADKVALDMNAAMGQQVKP